MQFTVEWTKESMAAVAAKFPEGQHLYMLNLLRFKAEVAGMPGKSGQEVFLGMYSPTFASIANALGVKSMPIWAGIVAGAVVGPNGERWDAIAIVEYQSFSDFRKVADSREYEEKAAPFRLAALEDCRLIACTKLELPR